MGLSIASGRGPILESGLARIGVAVLVALSIYVGFNYWIDRHEEQLAYMTVGAEIIAFAGLVIVRHHWTPKTWGWACIGLLLTALAAGWCGMTMFQKISDDTRARAIAAAEQTLPYRLAARELSEASDALSAKLREDQPQNVGPQTLAAWEVGQAAAVARLQKARDDAQARLDRATPQVSLDVMAVVRGVGVELIKLLGFAAFGLMGPSNVTPANVQPAPKRSLWGMARAVLGLGAMATGFAGVSHAETVSLPQVAADPTPATGADHVLVLNETWQARAFALRGKLTPEEIGDRVGRSRSTIYRLFAKRDAQLRQMAAAA